MPGALYQVPDLSSRDSKINPNRDDGSEMLPESVQPAYDASMGVVERLKQIDRYGAWSLSLSQKIAARIPA